MNWRPASPFDACLANELVSRAMMRDSHVRRVTAAVLHEGFSIRLEDVGRLLGVSRERANQLRRDGIESLAGVDRR